MRRLLLPLAGRFWPKTDTLSPLTRMTRVGDVFGALFGAPLAIAGMIWLGLVTDPDVYRDNWLLVLVVFALLYLFSRLNFFIVSESKTGVVPEFDGSLEPIVIFSAVFIIGPGVIWLKILWIGLEAIHRWRAGNSVTLRWNLARNTVLGVCQYTLAILLAFRVYEQSGGLYPIGALTTQNLVRAFVTVALWILLTVVLYLPLIAYWNGAIKRQRSQDEGFWLFFIFSISWQVLIVPFGVLAAAIYEEYNLEGYLFLVVGLLIVAMLAHRLSQAVESSRHRSVELAKLEALGRAVLNGAPDASNLPELLGRYVLDMFPHALIEIRLFPDQVLLTRLNLPGQRGIDLENAWGWLEQNPAPSYFSPQEILPWNHRRGGNAMVLVPIVGQQSSDKIVGGICVISLSVVTRHDPRYGADMLPAVQSLAAQIASALRRASEHELTLAQYRIEKELELAGEIQNSFLPVSQPEIEGWEMKVVLEPARQTSGDFYDLIALPDGRLGIVVADVADKGMGAALFMALCRTLLRTYSMEYITWPEIALQAANHRIKIDTRSTMFATVFYGVLDPQTGMLTYCNAGHNPPYVIRRRGAKGGLIQRLPRTGIPLGLFEGLTWEAEVVHLEVGDTLVVYTDGVTEAQNRRGAFYGEDRLRDVLVNSRWSSAAKVHDAVMRSVRLFIGNMHLVDDLTLLVMKHRG